MTKEIFKNQEKQITELLNIQEKLLNKINELQIKEQKYENMKSKIINLELFSADIIENIKQENMNAIYILEEIESEINVFKKDMMFLKDDLKIGTLTIEDRIDLMYNKLDFYKLKIEDIKRKFYKDNNIEI